MKVTYNWLKEYVKFETPVKDLAVKLTSVGPEVVAIKNIGISKENYHKIVLAKITAIENHPKADNLKILTLQVNKAVYRIITNSKIVEKGNHVVCALSGALLPNGIEIKEAVIKGEKSDGMLLAKENLNLEEKSAEVWNLGSDEKKARSLFENYTEEDYLLEIELTANRSDCLSVIGIAREVAAMLDMDFNIPKPPVQETLDELPEVEVEEKNLCPRYSARVLRSITVKDSPDWIKRRLELCGIRAINNIVDATNYVLLEYGHPMHAFDLKYLEGGLVQVRCAQDKEKFKTLDGQEHTLTEDMLVICDAKKPVALAGIMGGENSATLETTTDIFLESAYFEPVSIRKTAKKLGIKTESSYRFERGADWGITTGAIERATEIIMMTCSPKVSKIQDEYVNTFKDTIVNVKEDFVSGKLGVELSIKEIESILKRLKFTIVARRDDAIEVKVPSFRSDVSRPIDIVEEIARIYGYNSIPENRFKPPVDVEGLKPKAVINDRVREVFTGLGFTEVYNYSFTNDDDIKKHRTEEEGLLRLVNPLSNDASVMRNTLLSGILITIEYNVKNAYRNEARIYELGRTFIKKGNNYIETRKVAIAVFGSGADYYTLSGIVEKLLAHIDRKTLQYSKISRNFLHPVNSAALTFDGKVIGFQGEVHPDILEAIDLRSPVYYAEIETLPLQDYLNKDIVLKPIPKFPPTTRDLSLVVEQDILARDMMNDIFKVHEWVRDVSFVDIFKGLQIGQSKKSLTFSVTFQSQDKTLTDKEVNDVVTRIVEKLSGTYQAELR